LLFDSFGIIMRSTGYVSGLKYDFKLVYSVGENSFIGLKIEILASYSTNIFSQWDTNFIIYLLIRTQISSRLLNKCKIFGTKNTCMIYLGGKV